MRRRCEFVFETRMIMKGSFLHIVMYWNFAEGGFALSASNGALILGSLVVLRQCSAADASTLLPYFFQGRLS